MFPQIRKQKLLYSEAIATVFYPVAGTYLYVDGMGKTHGWKC